jgi:hypothetical protein
VFSSHPPFNLFGQGILLYSLDLTIERQNSKNHVTIKHGQAAKMDEVSSATSIPTTSPSTASFQTNLLINYTIILVSSAQETARHLDSKSLSSFPFSTPAPLLLCLLSLRTSPRLLPFSLLVVLGSVVAMPVPLLR